MRVLGVLIALAMLSACATGSNGYQDSTLGSTGLSDRRVSDRQWELGFRGSRDVAYSQLIDLFTLKAAEIGRREGFTHVVVEPPVVADYTLTRGTGCAGTALGRSVCPVGPIINSPSRIRQRATTTVTFFDVEVDDAISVDEAYERLAPFYLDGIGALPDVDKPQSSRTDGWITGAPGF